MLSCANQTQGAMATKCSIRTAPLHCRALSTPYRKFTTTQNMARNMSFFIKYNNFFHILLLLAGQSGIQMQIGIIL
jgi:hypothetical protein